jgi:hypothetical protein
MLIYSDFSGFQALVDLVEVDKGGPTVVREQRIESEEELFTLARKSVQQRRMP